MRESVCVRVREREKRKRKKDREEKLLSYFLAKFRKPVKFAIRLNRYFSFLFNEKKVS